MIGLFGNVLFTPILLLGTVLLLAIIGIIHIYCLTIFILGNHICIC